MNYEIIRINDDTWRIEDNGVRFFLLVGEERALLIDSGMNVHNARDIASGLTDLPITLINTHADTDHVGSNGQFASFYMHPADEPDYRRKNGQGEILPVRSGDVLELGGRTLEILHIPGHTPGSVALLDTLHRALISGDSIQNGRIFMFGRSRDMKSYIDSLERLRAWAGRFDEIWPSHGSFPVSPELIEKLRDGARAVLSGNVSGVPAELFGESIRVFDLGFATFLCNGEDEVRA